MKRYLITTVDNPYNPYDNFDEWYNWDISHGYYTSQRLGSLAKTNRYLMDAEQQRIINNAVDEMIRLDAAGIYKRIEVDD